MSDTEPHRKCVGCQHPLANHIRKGDNLDRPCGLCSCEKFDWGVSLAEGREYSHEFHIRVVNRGLGAYETNRAAAKRIQEILDANPDLEWPTTERGYFPSRVQETLRSRRERANNERLHRSREILLQEISEAYVERGCPGVKMNSEGTGVGWFCAKLNNHDGKHHDPERGEWGVDVDERLGQG